MLINTEDIQRKLRNNMLLILVLGIATTVLFLSIMHLLASNLFRKLRQAREEIRILSVTDELTGISNRRQGMTLFSRELDRVNRLGNSLACILMDIDDFKIVNDQYGHLVGDEVLRSVARTVEQMRRDYDIFCRFGGEEFLLVLPGASPGEATATAERVRNNIRTVGIEHPDLRNPIFVTVSLGVSSFRDGDLCVEDIIKRADQAMYRAKDTGKDRVCTG